MKHNLSIELDNADLQNAIRKYVEDANPNVVVDTIIITQLNEEIFPPEHKAEVSVSMKETKKTRKPKFEGHLPLHKEPQQGNGFEGHLPGHRRNTSGEYDG